MYALSDKNEMELLFADSSEEMLSTVITGFEALPLIIIAISEQLTSVTIKNPYPYFKKSYFFGPSALIITSVMSTFLLA